MMLRLALLLAPLLVLPAPAAAQPDLSAGTSLSLGYRQYLDTPAFCCPLWTWLELDAGPVRLHFDYLYSLQETEGYGGYPLDGDNGNAVRAGFDAPIDNASLLWHDIRVSRRHEASAMWVWRPLQRPGYTLNVLLGAALVAGATSDCSAQESPVEQVAPTPTEYSYDPKHKVFERRLTDGDRAACRDKRIGWHWGSRHIAPNYAATLDVSIGERAYLRVGYRLLWHAIVGAGWRF